jgi:hypothetical protein
MGRLRSQQDYDAVHRHQILAIQQGIVDKDVRVLGRRRTRLKIEVDDFLQGLAKTEDQVRAVVTVERSMLSKDTGKVDAVSKIARKPRGLTWAKSFNVASNGNGMKAPHRLARRPCS